MHYRMRPQSGRQVVHNTEWAIVLTVAQKDMWLLLYYPTNEAFTQSPEIF